VLGFINLSKDARFGKASNRFATVTTIRAQIETIKQKLQPENVAIFSLSWFGSNDVR